jgi:hypothetical protein
MVDASGNYLHVRIDDGDCNTLFFRFFFHCFLIVYFVHGFHVEDDEKNVTLDHAHNVFGQNFFFFSSIHSLKQPLIGVVVSIFKNFIL